MIKLFIPLLFAVLPSAVLAGASSHEYQIPASDLLTFSGSQIKARLCSGCDATAITVKPDSGFYEKNNSIDLSRATELYVSPQYRFVSLHVRTERGANTLLFVRFGPFDEGNGLTPPVLKEGYLK